MTATIINSNPLNDSHVLTPSPQGGCKHHTRNGRCRMPVADPLTSLCAEHARRQQKRDLMTLTARPNAVGRRPWLDERGSLL